ncbi:MAG: hypothetical protein K2K21_11615 [Lachnospiraceae bacterium]|nr:hypothetical protein [Lachnospiraceae bacterium]
MTVSNSVPYDLYLDLKRGLSDKRFWSVLGIFSLVFLLHIILTAIWPLTCHYFGGRGYIFELMPGIPFATQTEILRLTSMELLANFFPFIGSAAYAYTIIDDRKNVYYLQQTQRVGFSRYYWCKLIAGSILSGILGALIMVSICLLVVMFITYNPFFKDAVEYYTQYDEFIPGYITWEYGEGNRLITVTNPWVWWFVGGIKYFLEGILFGLIASVIAFFSDNRVFMTACPILYFIIEDKLLYMLRYLLGLGSNVSRILGKFSFRSEMGYFAYGNLYHFALLIFLIVLFLNLARCFQNRAERLYMEGGDVSD